MKRVGKILSLVMLMVVLSTSLGFAGTLNLMETYPADGATGTAIENVSVKLSRIREDLKKYLTKEGLI